MLTDESDEPNVTADEDDTALKTALKAKGYSDEEIEKICAKETPVAAADETDEEKPSVLLRRKLQWTPRSRRPRRAWSRRPPWTLRSRSRPTLSVRRSMTSPRRRRRSCHGSARSRIACDSADDVYRAALDVLKVDTTELPAGAARAVFNAIPAAVPVRRTHVPGALDAAAVKDSAIVTRAPPASDTPKRRT